MIVYLATYPRSGNALLRNLIGLNFGYLIANGYKENPQRSEKWEVRECEDEPHVLTYRSHGGERRRVLRGATLSFLDERERARFAAENNIYFVKTHELPFAHYFADERVIQLVRHPCPTIVSHWLLKRRNAPGKSLQAVAEKGGHTGASWSAYHEAWLGVQAPLLRLRYEDVVDDQSNAVVQAAAFLGLPLQVIRHMPVAAATARNPERNPGRGNDGWRESVSRHEAELIWAQHARVAQTFGYSAPDYGADGDSRP